MKDTALLVIDMQNGFLSERSPLYIDGAAATVPACTEMISFCRKKNVPVFFITRVYAADGSDVEHTRYDGKRQTRGRIDGRRRTWENVLRILTKP